MSTRIFKEDAITIALLYNYMATRDMLLSAEKVNEFDRIVDANLEEKNSKANIAYPLDNTKLIYFTSWDEVGNQYYILKPDFDEEKAIENYIYRRHYDVTIASQKENALDLLGLKLEDGKIQIKKNKVRKLLFNKK